VKFAKGLENKTGSWQIKPDILVSNVAKRDIYRSPLEPGFVAWTILWKERSGVLKLSFVEATGDLTAWPPTYNFNSRDIQQYLKTLVSKDNGNTWKDTGWRESRDPLSTENSHHFIHHVFELPDGTLMRNRCHAIKGVTCPMHLPTYNEALEVNGNFFAFAQTEPIAAHPSFASIWTSSDRGKSWKEIYVFDKQPRLFLTAIHRISDGSIVALGTIRDDLARTIVQESVLTESKDEGKTWSTPLVVADNDDSLNPQGIDAECDFVELEAGKIFVVWRTGAPGSCFRQQIIQRDSQGIWKPGPAEINSFFLHSGYPYLHRASDGTIFYYCHTSMKYSCDQGVTWGEVKLGGAYYGQLTEVSPGKMLAITQRNIGDSPYPYKCDSTMLQTTFNYERVGIVEQTDSDAVNALAMLNVDKSKDFHIGMEIKLDAASGLAYQVEEGSFRFVAVTMPANTSRVSNSDKGKEQNVFLVVGKVEQGKTNILRKICVSQAICGAWAELQVSRHDTLLKCALKVPHDVANDKYRPARYICFKDEGADSGSLALFTNRSTGTFRNVRFSDSAGEFYSNWQLDPDEGTERIALDAGREE